MADIGASIAVSVGIELVKFIIAEVNKHKQQVELANSYLGTYALSINETQLESDWNLAKIIERNPAISVEIKEDVKHAYDNVLEGLQEIKKDLGEYVNSGFLSVRTKKKALKRLDKRSKKLKDETNTFQILLLSLTLNSPIEELQLSTNDFDFLAGDQRMWITETVFTAEAWLSRPIRGVASGTHTFVLEHKAYEAKEKESIQLDVVLINQRLGAADRTQGIPHVLGFRDEPKDHGFGEFQLVMTVPNLSSKVETFENYLRSSQDIPSLNDRVRLCADLAEAVLHVHRLGLVHKNIRPENVLLVPDDASGALPIDGKLYLIGWQYARRTENFKTRRAGEMSWDRCIYQHPRRHGLRADSEYRMEHDIYSLGVCMLVILCWSNLVEEQDDDAVLSSSFRDVFFSLGFDDETNPRENYKTETDWMVSNADNVKKVLLTMVGTYLPRTAGTKIATAVTECLNGRVSKQVQETEVQDQAHGNQTEVGAHFVLHILAAIQSVAASI